MTQHADNLGWTGWGPREQEPTTLIALWPDGAAPTRTEVLAALAQAGIEPRTDLETEATSDDTLWTAVLGAGADSPPMIVWAEPAQPESAGELAGVDGAACKWVVGFQALVDADDPLPSFVELLRHASAGVPDAPAILDVSARRWLPQAQVAQLLTEEAPLPPSELLWTIEVVSKGAGPAAPPQGGTSAEAAPRVGDVWLRTQGLGRCGRPELEMVEVPGAQTAVAATLLNDVAELLLEVKLPDPGEALEIGVGLEIALQPWSAVGPFLSDGAAGAQQDRVARGLAGAENGAARDGDIAVVCAANPAGQYRKLWVWPRDVVRALAEDGAAVYRTTRSTERTAALAQHTWPELAMLWARVRKTSLADDESGAVILIKVGFEVVSEEAPAREHLWFMVREVAGDKARGQLINQPMHATTMREGDEVWLAREGVSDWRLILPRGIVQPADMLLRGPELEKLITDPEHAP